MSDSDTADNERGPAQWWSEKIKEAFDQGVSAEFCAWQDVQLLRARVAELEALVKDAYYEGWDEALQENWLRGVDSAWKSSETLAALEGKG